MRFSDRLLSNARGFVIFKYCCKEKVIEHIQRNFLVQCYCDTMDGRPRKDIGVVTKPEDLPVGSVTFNEIGDSSSGQYFVAPLKCSRQEFGKPF